MRLFPSNSPANNFENRPGYGPMPELEIQTISKKCRGIVLRRAMLSASVAAIPFPGLDLLTDIGLLVRVMNTINLEFGLTPAQLEQLQPDKKVVAYQAIIGIGNLFVGKLVTHRLLVTLLRRSGIKVLSRQSAKIIPIAGQIISAAIGFSAFRSLGNAHIDACANVAGQILRPI